MEKLNDPPTVPMKNWCSHHPIISKKIVFFKRTLNSKTNYPDFREKRENVHVQTVNSLISFNDRVHSMIKLIEKDLGQESSTLNMPKIGDLIYNEKSSNMTVRKLYFAEHSLKRLKIDVFNIKYSELIEMAQQIEETIELFKKKENIIPEDTIVFLDNNFISFNNFSGFNNLNKVVKSKMNEITMLEKYIIRTKNEIAAFQAPIWFLKSYSVFATEIVFENIKNVESETNYIAHQDCEVSLSRCFFHPKSQFSSGIDKAIQNFTKVDQKFLIKDQVMKICRDFVPANLSNSDKKHNSNHNANSNRSIEHSILITFLFRVIFDRIYEKHGEILTNFEINNENSQFLKSMEMEAIDCWPKDYIINYLPHGIHNFSYFYEAKKDKKEDFDRINDINYIINSNKKEIINGLFASELNFDISDEKKNEINKRNNEGRLITSPNAFKEDIIPSTMKIVDFFKADPFFSVSAVFIEETIFATNPIDILYLIHKAIGNIQTGAIAHKVEKKLISMENQEHVLCFDDLFTLFFGTYIAADFPDLFKLNEYFKIYAPEDSLSPSLDYARASIEGLAVHARTVIDNQKKGKF